MPNVSDTAAGQQARTSSARKLLQAAALASMLVPLGTVHAEAATINCVSEGSLSSGSNNCGSGFGPGAYSPESGTNIWKFFDNATYDPQTESYVDFQDLIYTVEISGTPTTAFTLSVSDRVFATTDVANFADLSAFPGATCIPIFNTGFCAVFDVFVTGEATWNGDYEMEIRWFWNGDGTESYPTRPPEDGFNHILRAPTGFEFTQALHSSDYDRDIDPVDPALSGRGNSFSSFLPARANVPEPSMLLLFGAATGVSLYRRRRR